MLTIPGLSKGTKSVSQLQDARNRFVMKRGSSLRDPVMPHGRRRCLGDLDLVPHLNEPRQRKRPD